MCSCISVMYVVMCSDCVAIGTVGSHRELCLLHKGFEVLLMFNFDLFSILIS